MLAATEYLAVAIADQEPPCVVVEVHQRVVGRLGHPRPGGVRGVTGQVDPAVL